METMYKPDRQYKKSRLELYCGFPVTYSKTQKLVVWWQSSLVLLSRAFAFDRLHKLQNNGVTTNM